VLNFLFEQKIFFAMRGAGVWAGTSDRNWGFVLDNGDVLLLNFFLNLSFVRDYIPV